MVVVPLNKKTGETSATRWSNHSNIWKTRPEMIYTGAEAGLTGKSTQ